MAVIDGFREVAARAVAPSRARRRPAGTRGPAPPGRLRWSLVSTELELRQHLCFVETMAPCVDCEIVEELSARLESEVSSLEVVVILYQQQRLIKGPSEVHQKCIGGLSEVHHRCLHRCLHTWTLIRTSLRSASAPRANSAHSASLTPHATDAAVDSARPSTKARRAWKMVPLS